LTAPATDGYWANALFANFVAPQPPFCFGTAENTSLDTSKPGTLTITWTFIPTSLAQKLTMDSIALSGELAKFNAPVRY